jgi:hypothetical protein
MFSSYGICNLITAMQQTCLCQTGYGSTDYFQRKLIRGFIRLISKVFQDIFKGMTISLLPECQQGFVDGNPASLRSREKYSPVVSFGFNAV